MNRVLVAGIGNIFMGDDGFGCEVARQLTRCELPEGVDVVDFGIRGLDLSHALSDGYELAILIDTVDRGGAPGTLHVIEPEIDGADPGEPLIAPHGMDPATVLRFVASLGERRPRVLLVACQPEYLGGEHGHIGLSTAVATAVGKAVTEVRAILDEALPGGMTYDRRSYAAPGGMT